MTTILALLLVITILAGAFGPWGQVLGYTAPPASGTWNIADETWINDTIIYLNGDLEVDNGGILILSNVTIQFNCTSDGEFGLYVMSGGYLRADNGTIFTDHTTDADDNSASDYEFWIYIESGSETHFYNSTIREAGTEGTSTDLYFDGTSMFFNNTVITDCLYAVYVTGQDIYMRNTTIQNIYDSGDVYGLYLETTNDPVFEDVTIDSVMTSGTSSSAYGVYLYNTYSLISDITVRDVFSDDSYGIYSYYPITEVSDIWIDDVNSTDYSYGYYSYDTIDLMHNVTITNTYGDDDTYGLYAGWYLYELNDVIVDGINSDDATYGMYLYKDWTEAQRCHIYDIDGKYTSYGFYAREDIDKLYHSSVANFNCSASKLYGIYIYDNNWNAAGDVAFYSMYNGSSEDDVVGYFTYNSDCTVRDSQVYDMVMSPYDNYDGALTGFDDGIQQDLKVYDCVVGRSVMCFRDYYSLHNATAYNIRSKYFDGMYQGSSSSTETRDCEIFDIKCRDFGGLDVNNNIINVDIHDVDCEVGLDGYYLSPSSGTRRIFNSHTWNISATDGDLYKTSYAFVKNCTITNVTMAPAGYQPTIISSDNIYNVSIVDCAGKYAINGWHMDNVTVKNFIGRGFLMNQENTHIENSTFIGVWDELVYVSSYYDMYMRNCDIIAPGRHFVNNYYEQEILFDNCYFGGINTAVLDEISIDPTNTYVNTRTTPNRPLSTIYVNGTKTFSGADLDLRDGMIINGDATINGGNIKGAIWVEGNLTIRDTNVTESGLIISTYTTGKIDIDGFDASRHRGAHFNLRSDDSYINDFQVVTKFWGAYLMNVTNTVFSNGYFLGYTTDQWNGIRVDGCKDLTVRNVNISNYINLIATDDDTFTPTNIHFEGLDLYEHGWAAVWVWGAKNVRVANCTVQGVGYSKYGIRVRDVFNAVVYNNTIKDLYFYGTTPYDLDVISYGGEVSYNHVDSYYSATLLGDESVLWPIEDTLIHHNYFNNWYVDMTGDNSPFYNNTIEESTVYVFDDYQVIENNTFIRSHWGLNLSKRADHTVVFNNTFLNQSNTALLIYSDFNTVYHNDFYNNTRHVFVSTSTNIFRSAEDEGNYWDNYLGIDLDGDGIGDTRLPHMNQDSQPWMYLTGWKLAPFNVQFLPPQVTSVESTIDLDWTVSIMAKRYVVEVSNSTDFTTPLETLIYPFGTNAATFGPYDNGTYFFRIKGVNRNGESDISDVINVTVAIPPETPEIYTNIDVDTDGIYTLRWYRIKEASSYELQEDDNYDFKSPTTYTSEAWNYTFSGKNNDTYYYRVRAVNESRTSDWSHYVQVDVMIPPGTPSINITEISPNGQFLLNWTDIDGAYIYKVEEYEGILDTDPITLYSQDSYYELTGKTDGVYLYRIQAVAGTGLSEWSQKEPWIVDWVPEVPDIIIEPVPEGNAIQFGWETTDKDITDYELQYLVDKNWTQLELDQKMIWSGLVDDVNFTFRLRVRDAKGQWSEFTEPMNGSAHDSEAPPPPSIVDVGLFAEGGALRLTWQDVAAADVEEYNVYFSTNGLDWILSANYTNEEFEHKEENLTNGQFYYFYVTSLDEVPNESVPSVTRARYCDMDTDGDNIPDEEDKDDDGDGYPDDVDEYDRNPLEWKDTDKDSIGDNQDTDDDDDGYPDYMEETLNASPLDRESTPADMDFDFLPDRLDPDRDGDGYLNDDDAFPDDPAAWNDTDEDGMPDKLHGLSTTGLIEDDDIDGDGLDINEENKKRTNPFLWDTDGDGYNDKADDYPLDPNRHERTDVVFTIPIYGGIDVAMFDLITTILGLLASAISFGFGYFMLTIKSRRYKRHKQFIKRSKDPDELGDYYITVCLPDIQRERIKPNDSVLLRHEYSTRMKKLKGTDDVKAPDSPMLFEDKTKGKEKKVEEPKTEEYIDEPALPEEDDVPDEGDEEIGYEEEYEGYEEEEAEVDNAMRDFLSEIENGGAPEDDISAMGDELDDLDDLEDM